MSEEQTVVDDEEIPENPEEAQEAEGVAEIEASTELSPEDAEAADQSTLEGLEEEERADLEEEAAELGREDPQERRARGSVRLSKNFVLAEFHCNDGTPVPSAAIPALRRLVKQVLQPMREEFGQCRVTSGYRTASWNKKMGGAPNSQHVYDRTPESVAADITFPHGSVDDWAAFARRRLGNTGGIGRYYRQNFVHVDNGRLSRWGS